MCEESGGTAAVPGVGVFRRGRHGPFQGRWTPRGLKSGLVPLQQRDRRIYTATRSGPKMEIPDKLVCKGISSTAGSN